MKKLIPVAAAALIAGLLAFVLIPAKPAAPAFSLTSLDGRPVNNGTLNGKVSFINFWYPSCPGCVKEMPLVIKMAHDYQSRPDFQVIGISLPFDPLPAVQTYAAEKGMNFTVAYDSGKTAARERFPAPTVITEAWAATPEPGAATPAGGGRKPLPAPSTGARSHRDMSTTARPWICRSRRAW